MWLRLGEFVKGFNIKLTLIFRSFQIILEAFKLKPKRPLQYIPWQDFQNVCFWHKGLHVSAPPAVMFLVVPVTVCDVRVE